MSDGLSMFVRARLHERFRHASHAIETEDAGRDPALLHTLRDAHAKLTIVGMYETAIDPRFPSEDDAGAKTLRRVVQLLADIDREHPDYLAEWRPWRP